MMKAASTFRRVPAYFFAAAVLVSGLSLTPAYAQDGEKQTEADAKTEGGKETKGEETEEIVRTGTIASTGSYGFGPQSINSDSSGAAPGDEASVITGSVSQSGRDECTAAITNTSEENDYSVSYRIIGRSKGSQVFSKSFGERLSPGESKTRTFRCDPDWNMEVNLRSARKR